MKKLLSTFLIVVMLVTLLPISSFAEEVTGSITIENPIAGKTYHAYKIFDVTYNEDRTAYAYTINSSSPWWETVSYYAENESHGLTLVASAADPTTYIVKVTDAFSAARFTADLADGDIVDESGVTLAIPEGATYAIATGLDLGYYFVTSNVGSICNLTTTTPDVYIRDKNDITFEKTDDKESVCWGNFVSYTICSKIPDTTGFSTYTYKITDTLSDGLSLDYASVDVGVADNDGPFGHIPLGDGSVRLNYPDSLDSEFWTLIETENGFELSVDVMRLQDRVGEYIVIEYRARLNENGVGKVEKNSATLEYSNWPYMDTTATTPPDEETVYSSTLVIDKHQTDNESFKLPGAQFILYKFGPPPLKNGQVLDVFPLPLPEDPLYPDQEPVDKVKYYYYWNDTYNWVSWSYRRDKATVVTTDENGYANFPGLEDGTYYLEEIKAPDGYNQLSGDIEIEIDGSNATMEDMSSLTYTAKVANNTGSELPETGGIGTTLFYVFGGIMMLAAVVLLVTKKRMAA